MNEPMTVPELRAATAHLWEFSLEGDGDESILADDERTRARKYHFERDRKRYVIGRAMLRRILAAYVGKKPADLVFTYGPSGKPELKNSELSFNLAHSGPQALLVVTRDVLIGVDIEQLRPMKDIEDVAKFSFSDGEFARWRERPDSEQVEAFYHCWTRKEAYLKAIGEGIAKRLKTFEVAFESDREPCILFGAEGEWTLADVSRKPSYIAAIAGQGPPLRVERLTAPQ